MKEYILKKDEDLSSNINKEAIAFASGKSMSTSKSINISKLKGSNFNKEGCDIQSAITNNKF